MTDEKITVVKQEEREDEKRTAFGPDKYKPCKEEDERKKTHMPPWTKGSRSSPWGPDGDDFIVK
jgi:hypothetical protein